MAETTKAQEATLQRFVDAWKQWNAQGMILTFSEDFTQVTLPLALNVPSRSRAEVGHTFPLLVDIVKKYELIIHNIVHDEERSIAAIYAMSTGELPWEDRWTMEYATFVTFDESGEKIVRLEEMLDSKEFQGFFPRFREHISAMKG